MQVVTEAAQDDGSDYESPSPGKRTKRKKFKAPSFSPEAYRFKKNDYNVAQDMYKESFYEHKEVNKSKINQKLVEATYLQVIHRFEKEKKMHDFPTEFRQNEMKWAGLMMRNKKLQKIMAEFTDRVGRVLEDEIRGNQTFIKDWISYPHRHSPSPNGRN